MLHWPFNTVICNNLCLHSLFVQFSKNSVSKHITEFVITQTVFKIHAEIRSHVTMKGLILNSDYDKLPLAIITKDIGTSLYCYEKLVRTGMKLEKIPKACAAFHCAIICLTKISDFFHRGLFVSNVRWSISRHKIRSHLTKYSLNWWKTILSP